MSKIMRILAVALTVPAAYAVYKHFMERKIKQSASKYGNSFKISDLEEFTVVIGPISMITFYKDLPVQSILDRFELILQYNPWLASRMFKINGEIEYRFNTINKASDYISVFESDLEMSLNPIEFLRYCKLKRGIDSINNNVPLFQVDIIKLKDGFALMQSMCHSLGDGDTHYKICKLFDSNEPIRSYVPNRVQGMDQLIPVFGVAKGPFAKWLGDRFVFRALNPLSHPTRILKVNLQEIERLKQSKEHLDGQPFISTHDILTSWAYSATQAYIGASMVNLRGKLDKVHHHLAGNYFTEMCYTNDSYITPGQIRRSITKRESQPYYVKATDTAFPEYPTVSDKEKSLTSLTNWTSFYHHVTIDGNEPVYHCPLLAPITPDAHVISIFTLTE
ncbi:hypothetical protein HDV01_003278 [Terramyces sp. JEL0728]|nr:hypothetical protein HDV01_003278 [Terramyces sp. JEL0728]